MVYYSHVNEDNVPEREAVLQQQPDTLVGITGSGERLLALLDAPSLRRVIAVDTNSEAQHLFAIKLAALKVLSVDDYLGFIGHLALSAAQRREQLAVVWPHLGNETQSYWLGRVSVIERGIDNAGHFERYLARLRPLVNLLLGAQFRRCFTTPVTQIANFPHRRWQGLMALFSQTWVYQLTGNSDLAFTAPDCDSRLIARALQRTLEQDGCADSFMFHLIFTGHLRNMTDAQLPPSLQPAILHRIQQRLRQDDLTIQFVNTDVCQYLRQSPAPAEAVFLSLSDLLSFVSASDLVQVLAETKEQYHHTDVQGVVRSFLRHDFQPAELDRLGEFASIQNISEQERTRMYQVYHFSL